MNKITKEIGAQLKEIADKLPEIPVAKIVKMTGAEIIEKATPEELEKKFKDVDPKREYTVRTEGAREAVNHSKRIRSAYMQAGWPGVSRYVDPFREKPKMEQPQEAVTETPAE